MLQPCGIERRLLPAKSGLEEVLLKGASIFIFCGNQKLLSPASSSRQIRRALGMPNDAWLRLAMLNGWLIFLEVVLVELNCMKTPTGLCLLLAEDLLLSSMS